MTETANTRRRPAQPTVLAREDAFTMIELLVTMVVLAVSLTGLAALQLTTIRQVTASKSANEATRLGQAMIERHASMSFAAASALVSNDWVLVTRPDGSVVQNVAVDGVSPGPYTAHRMLEIRSGRLLISIRVSWIDISPGSDPDPTKTYDTLSVIMTTQVSP